MNVYRRQNRATRRAFRRAWKRTAPTRSLREWASSIAGQAMTPWGEYAALWLDAKYRGRRARRSRR